MKAIKFKKFTIKYEFNCSVWTNESMTVEALTIEQARQKVINEICGAYGSQILTDLIIKN